MNQRFQLEVKRRKLLYNSINQGRRLELIVNVDEKYSDRAVSELERVGEITRVFELIPYVSLKCDARQAAAMLRPETPGERHISRLLKRIEASADFSIPPFRKSAAQKGYWNLEMIGAYEAQQHSAGEGVGFAVIDTGVEYSHPEVSGRFSSYKGYDFVSDSSEPYDRNGHGTHVAGIGAGSGRGVAVGCRLYSVRVLDENGSGRESDVIAGIEWCIRNGMNVANMSLGSPVASSAFEEICAVAADNGVVLVAAAGNDGGPFPNYPAAFGDTVIAVAAVDRLKQHPDFSTTYQTNDASGPGVGITSSYIGGSYATLDGTSMASPHVAGAISLAIPLMRGGSIEELVERHSEPLGERDVFGAGLVRADLMVASLIGKSCFYRLVEMAGKYL